MRAAHAGSIDRVQTIVEDTCLLSDRRECGRIRRRKADGFRKNSIVRGERL